MNDLLLLIAQNGVLLVAGSTLLLSLGCGAVLLCKSPIHRQRISELTIAGVLGWMMLALFPLPRLLPDNYLGSFSAKPQAAEKPNLPIALDAASPMQTGAETSLPLAETPAAGPVVLPEVGQWVHEGASDDDLQKADGLGNPSYEPLPSEELSRLAAEVYLPKTTEAATDSTLSAWQWDLTKLAGLCTGAYLAGAALCVFWIVTGHVLLLRIRQTAEAPPGWLAKQYRTLAKQSGIAAPQLIVSHLCTRPLTWGVLWPIVVLPRSLCRQENKSQLETILLHELGHIAQQDSQGNLLYCAALPLLYAHPLFWWLRRESQLAAELVADDWAAWQTGKETYVEELVALARCTGTSSLPLVGVTGLFSSPSQFYRRMHMLLAREKPLSTKTSLPWRLASLSALAGAVVLAASLAGVRPAAGQTEPPAAAPAVDEPAVAPPLAPVPVPAALAPPVLDTPSIAPPVAVPPPVAPAGTTPPAAVPAPPAFRLAEIKESPADPDEAALLAEIKQMQDKLHALQAKRGIKFYPPVPVGAAAIAGGNKVAITRTDGEGRVWTEIVEGDAVKPAQLAASPDGKVIVKAIIDKDGNPQLHLIDAATGKILATAPAPAKGGQDSPDWKRIVKEVVDKDGVRKQYWLDAATGKVIESVPAPAKGEPTIEWRPTPSAANPNDPQKPDAPRTTAPRRSELRFPTPIMPGAAADPSRDPYGTSAVQPAGVPNMARGAQQFDLVTLATSYADAVGVLEAAQAKVEEHGKLSDKNVISQQEVTAAKLALSAAQRKEQLLRSIAEVATESAAQEFERTSQLHKSGVISNSDAGEARTRMEILKQILRTRPAESAPKN